MKGATLLTFDTDVVGKVRRAMTASGIVQPSGTVHWQGCAVVYDAPDAIQVQELGTDHVFSLDEYDDRPDFASAYRDPPYYPGPGVVMPDMTAILGYGIDCRWEDLFVRLVRVVTEVSGEPAWVLDNNAIVWDARDVDPDRVFL